VATVRSKATGDVAEIDTRSPFGNHSKGGWRRLVWHMCDWPGFSQQTRQKLRKRFARKLAGPFDVTFQGMKFRLYPAENYCDRVIFGRGELPEPAEHEALVPHIRPGMTFVDIGGNIGSYSIFVGIQAKRDITLVALEPHPRTYQKLLFNLKANGLPTQHVMNLGAGAEHDTLDLWSDGGSNIGHTSMLRAGTANPKVAVKVPVAPLTALLDERGIDHVDLLKIDIEGFEDRALGPFLENVPATGLPRHILIETSHQELWEQDLIKMLQAKGYWAIFETEQNQLWART